MSEKPNTQIVMQIPEEVIKAQVQAAVASALAKNPDELIRACVEMAMNQKRDGYSRTTIWDDMVATKIRETAAECFSEWLVEQVPNIRKHVRAKLEQRRGQYFDKCVDALTEAMGKNFSAYVTVKD